jgi:alginate O-acetyltransferase complex protein AlgI
MLFHSFAYLALFSATFAVYWALDSVRLRTAWLVLASVGFYTQWSVPLLGVVLFTVLFDYAVALRLDAAPARPARRRLLAISLVLSLGLLAFFKYSQFAVDLLWRARSALAATTLSPPLLGVVLPLGISFYTFETISYVVDVYRGRVRAERRLLNYALFLLFFPHLIAGPIVRARHFLRQVDRPKRWSWPRLSLGAQLFVRGLLKKAVVADQMARLVDPVFDTPSAYATGTLWIAAVCYAAQVYCDFSGYSDMAIGSAHALGFKLPLNFNRPYLAENIAEFWRRWHITLSSWLRDYVYIPLGGSRCGRWRTAAHLVITLALAGAWHGAGLTYIVFGVMQGLWLAVHRLVPWPQWTGHRALRPLRIALTCGLFALSLVIFRSPSLSQAWTMLGRMLAPSAGLIASPAVQTSAIVAIAGLWIVHGLGGSARWRRVTTPWPVGAAALGGGLVLAELFSPAAGGAFVYFQF